MPREYPEGEGGRATLVPESSVIVYLRAIRACISKLVRDAHRRSGSGAGRAMGAQRTPEHPNVKVRTSGDTNEACLPLPATRGIEADDRALRAVELPPPDEVAAAVHAPLVRKPRTTVPRRASGLLRCSLCSRAARTAPRDRRTASLTGRAGRHALHQRCRWHASLQSDCMRNGMSPSEYPRRRLHLQIHRSPLAAAPMTAWPGCASLTRGR